MTEQTPVQKTNISQATTEEEIGEFWDTHDLTDYWDQTQEVHFEVRAKPRHRVIIDPEVFVRVQSEANTRGVSPETLINLWLLERLQPPSVDVAERQLAAV